MIDDSFELMRRQMRRDVAQGYDRDSARFFVAEELSELLAEWGVKRKLGEGE